MSHDLPNPGEAVVPTSCSGGAGAANKRLVASTLEAVQARRAVAVTVAVALARTALAAATAISTVSHDLAEPPSVWSGVHTAAEPLLTFEQLQSMVVVLHRKLQLLSKAVVDLTVKHALKPVEVDTCFWDENAPVLRQVHELVCLKVL